MNRMLGFGCVGGVCCACATRTGAPAPSADAAASVVPPSRMLRLSTMLSAILMSRSPDMTPPFHHWTSQLSVHPLHRRRRPGAVEDVGLRPIGAHEQREISLRRWQPVGALRFWRRIGLNIECQRTVWVELQRLVLCAERVLLEFVRREEVVLIV